MGYTLPEPTVAQTYRTPRIVTGEKPRSQIGYRVMGLDGTPASRIAVQAIMWGSTYAFDFLYGPGAIPFFVPLKNIEEEYVGGWKWEVVAHYESAISNPQTGDLQDSFEITGGSKRIYVAHYGTVATYGTPPSGIDNSLNVTADGVQGVDWPPPPDSVFNKTAYIAAAAMTPTFMQTLRDSIRCVSSVPFFNTNIGECCVLGINGQYRARATDWELRFQFGHLRNVNASDGIMYGSLGPIAANGWDYIDVHTLNQSVGSGASARLLAQVDYVRVMRPSRYIDFSVLGIGTM
jgi:hypothetical protein